MKSGALPTHFTRTGLGFSDGTEIPADLIVFCTGFIGNMRTNVAKIFGQSIADRVDDFWGLDEEAELKGAFKGTGRKLSFPFLLFFLWYYYPSDLHPVLAQVFPS
jgi:hypothetical protein